MLIMRGIYRRGVSPTSPIIVALFIEYEIFKKYSCLNDELIGKGNLVISFIKTFF